MQLAHLDAEPADRRQAERGEQAGAVGGEQLVEGPSHLVVVEQPRLAVTEAEERCVVVSCPGRQPVKGPTGERQVAHEDADRLSRADPTPEVGLGQVGGHEFVEAEPGEHGVHDRKRPDLDSMDLEVVRVDPHHVPQSATVDTEGGGW